MLSLSLNCNTHNRAETGPGRDGDTGDTRMTRTVQAAPALAVSLGIKCGTSSVGAAWSADSADQGVAVISPGLTPQTLRGTSLHPEMQSTKCF